MFPAQQLTSLLALYSSTGGSSWRDRLYWTSVTQSPCTWFGVECDAAQTEVRSLRLPNNKLVSTLPTEIGLLTGLTFLSLQMNRLEGPLPSELGLLTSLVDGLHLYGNRFSGKIPTELGLLTKLSTGLFLHNVRRNV